MPETNWTNVDQTTITWTDVDTGVGEQWTTAPTGDSTSDRGVWFGDITLYPAMQDDQVFSFGTDLDFGIKYDSTKETLEFSTLDSTVMRMHKEGSLELINMIALPSDGNIAYVNGKLMINEPDGGGASN